MSDCSICNSETVLMIEGVSDAVTGENFDVRYCPRCEIGVTVPHPPDISRYYSNYYGGRHGATAGFRAKRRFALLQSSVTATGDNKRVLDIGCGEGEFLEHARRNGWQVVGIERRGGPDLPIENYTDFAGVNENFAPASFNAVTMWHSLEHLSQPSAALREAYRLLGKDGRLLVAVPDAFGLQARLFGRNWLHLDCPRHLFHFGCAGLVKLLNSCGFKIESMGHVEFEYDLLGISQSALNKISSTPNVFFSRLTNKPVSVGKLSVAAHFIAGLVFTAIALPAVAVGALSKKGGTIVVSASKDSLTTN